MLDKAVRNNGVSDFESRGYAASDTGVDYCRGLVCINQVLCAPCGIDFPHAAFGYNHGFVAKIARSKLHAVDFRNLALFQAADKVPDLAFHCSDYSYGSVKHFRFPPFVVRIR